MKTISKTFPVVVEHDYDPHGADYGILKIDIPFEVREELKKEGLQAGDEVEITIKKPVDVRKVMFENNICGSDAKSLEELVEELKCDNLQLMADLRAAKSEIERLREVGNRR